MRTILFVDDEAKVLNGYRRILQSESEDWELHFFERAEDLLEHLRSHPADAVVTDVKMPGMDGLELLAVLKAPEWLNIPVIVVTGLREQGLKRRALDLGAFDLLEKPVNPEDLVARIRNVIRIRHYQEELQRQNEILETRVQERTRDIEKSHQEVVLHLARAAEYRDEDTGIHVLRVSHYTRPVCRNLGMSDEACQTIFITSALHDLGKIGIPDRVLLKAGRLNEEEWRIVKQHCSIGAGILRQDHSVFRMLNNKDEPGSSGQGMRNPFLQTAATIALYHHERWDGGGYPFGLVGEEIPLEARIVALVDVFDALSTNRPYRAALSEKEALAMIRSGVGTHFDPQVYSAFEQSLAEIRVIRAEFTESRAAEGGPEA